jgi:multicomponent Na+:H+ antiporter subunit C
MVDPVPQALVLTAIVIGVAVTALALTIVIRLHDHHKTLDISKIRELKW